MKLTKKIKDALDSEAVVKGKSDSNEADLKEQVKALLEEVDNLKVLKLRLIEKDKLEYVEKREKIGDIFDNCDVLISNISNLEKNLATVNVVAAIGGLANPTSVELMGNSFIDKMHELATTILLEKIPIEQRIKSSGFLAGLIKSPFIKGLLDATPVGLIVNGIIGSIKTRATTFISGKLRDRVRNVGDINLETRDAFNLQQINKFEASLQSYILFYDGLRVAKQKLDTKLGSLNLEIINLKTGSSKFYKEFLSGLKIKSRKSTSLEKKFPSSPPDKYSDLVSLQTNGDFLKSVAKYENYLEIKFRFNKLDSDFKSILSEYFSNIKVILKGFSKIEKGAYKDKITAVIEDLDQQVNIIIGSSKNQ